MYKLEDHPDVNEQVLILGLEIHRNATRSVNTSAILDRSILNDKLQPYNQHQISLLKPYERSNILVIGCWITYIKKLKVVDEALESFKNLIKKLYNKRDTSFQLNESKFALKSLRYSIE